MDAPRFPAGSMRILVVDDEVQLRELLRQSLVQIGGFTADIAPGGEEALRKIDKDTFDLVLTQSVEIAPGNKHLRYEIQGGKTMAFKAGQFVQMFIPHDGKIRRTSYSIASSPTHRRCPHWDTQSKHIDRRRLGPASRSVD